VHNRRAHSQRRLLASLRQAKQVGRLATLVAAGVATAALALSPSAATAQTSDGGAGEEWDVQIALRNPLDQPARLSLSLGTVEVSGKEALSVTHHPDSRWNGHIDFPNAVELDARAVSHIPVRVHLPADTPAGRHVVALVAKAEGHHQEAAAHVDDEVITFLNIDVADGSPALSVSTTVQGGTGVGDPPQAAPADVGARGAAQFAPAAKVAGGASAGAPPPSASATHAEGAEPTAQPARPMRWGALVPLLLLVLLFAFFAWVERWRERRRLMRSAAAREQEARAKAAAKEKSEPAARNGLVRTCVEPGCQVPLAATMPGTRCLAHAASDRTEQAKLELLRQIAARHDASRTPAGVRAAM
jgi:hypothetical protein